MSHSVSTVLLGLIALCLLSTCYAGNELEKSHHLVVGSRVWGDTLLQTERVQKDYSWFRVNTEERTFSGDGVSTITQIKVLDQKKDGTGGYATILNGGPGQSFATIKFKSRRSQPIDFVVEVYAKRGNY